MSREHRFPPDPSELCAQHSRYLHTIVQVPYCQRLSPQGKLLKEIMFASRRYIERAFVLQGIG